VAGKARREMTDPWAFGWTQLLAIAALAASGLISWLGLRTFNKWQREKIEERRMEVAFEALALAYESEMVFEDIRRRFVHGYEYAGMSTEGMSDREKEKRSTSYAIIKRLERHLEFFDRVLKFQPRFMAAFGKQTASTFQKLHMARNMIQAACEILIFEAIDGGSVDEALVAQMRADIWDHTSPLVGEPKRVTKLLETFRAEVEHTCAPVIEHRSKVGKWYARIPLRSP
jgi:hypothetical protein